ncbi:uncharacterized protein [Macrobrachium rosenbergii]|uniref:uncharacterized protein n=1 Tax=Macrobrachium rosenbergii TaxID=79674 RepID=UPI0034D6C912
MNKIICVLFTLHILLAGGTENHVEISRVRLTKYTRERPSLNLGDEDLSYTLECMYTAPRKSITKIVWTLEGYDHDVYTWDATSNTVTVDEPLLGHVETDTDDYRIGPNIHFKTPSSQMRGIYTCVIFHKVVEQTVNPVVYEFDLKMYYFDNTPYEMSASLEGCDVLWSYSSNFLYPKPNVKCGFWDKDVGRSLSTVGAGLMFRQSPTGIWQVLMEQTRVKIRDIPRGSLFYCNVDLPIANFTYHLVLQRNQDTEDVYQEINRKGCPVIEHESPYLKKRIQNCKMNCRDECSQKISRYPVVTQFWCSENHYAYWEKNRSSSKDWHFEPTCEPPEHVWHSDRFSALTLEDMPLCLNSGPAIFCSSYVMTLLVSTYLVLIAITF